MEQEPIAGPSTAKDISNGPAMSGDKSLTKLKAPPVKFRTINLVPLETRNWLLYTKYCRQEFEECKLLIEQELEQTGGNNECANYIYEIMKERSDLATELGLLYLQEGQNEKALNKLAYAIAHDQVHAKALLAIGTEFQEFEECKLLIEQELEQTGGNNECANYIYFSSNSDLATELGLLYLQEGQNEKALNKLAYAIAHDQVHAKALLAIGTEFQKYKEPEIALAKYKLAAQKLTESSSLWNNIGMCFFSKKKFVAAISCLKRAIYLAPLDWKINYNMGLLHLHTRQYASAYTYLSAAVKSNRTHAHTYMLLAITLKHLEDTDNARMCFEQALSLSKHDLEVLLNYAIFLQSVEEDNRSREILKEFFLIHQNGTNVDTELSDTANELSRILLPVTREHSHLSEPPPIQHEPSSSKAQQYHNSTNKPTPPQDPNNLIMPTPDDPAHGPNNPVMPTPTHKPNDTIMQTPTHELNSPTKQISTQEPNSTILVSPTHQPNSPIMPAPADPEQEPNIQIPTDEPQTFQGDDEV
ncbi:Bardet-Biedl syndrome 4 protein homolog [Diaphorina citri]|uniref:Bardet-Biedl syndrome 4 protein homolog n=1 Tax=Diaphorina citri TaxID=121845 RepID=A0A3Q0JFB4_DIACI|nr:Bardet-Biedl syndrome 4 protein homolog [Diaphorina citri]